MRRRLRWTTVATVMGVGAAVAGVAATFAIFFPRSQSVADKAAARDLATGLLSLSATLALSDVAIKYYSGQRYRPSKKWSWEQKQRHYARAKTVNL